MALALVPASLSALLSTAAPARAAAQGEPAARPAPVPASREGIASAHPLASEAGRQVLAAGGNAFDAAIAVAAALAVVEPYSSGIGGGGFFLLHRAHDGHQVMVDARETAPAAADAHMYVDESGRAVPRASLDGARAAAIPGLPAGIVHLSRQYGRLPLARSLAPAIGLARDGFTVDARFATVARLASARLQRDARTAAVFMPAGRALAEGDHLRQPALAATLERLARDGHAGFYAGPVAAELVASVRADGGIWQAHDLAAYAVVERPPMRFEYRGATITAAALPSSGGVVIAQSLAMLSRFGALEHRSPAGAHLVSEALRRAFDERARWLGDPDYDPVPLDRLLSEAHLRARGADIDPLQATPSSRLGDSPAARGSTDTTHLSVVDRDGNRVAATLTINTLFGSGFIAGSTGVLLNNEMDDFALPGAQPNAYGLTGREANRIEPGKRPLSSMTPMFVETARGVHVLGAPGGSRIISMLLLAVLDITSDDPPSPAVLVARPRYHHQFRPDRIEVEPGAFADDWIDALRSRGHAVTIGGRAWGNMQVVHIDRASGEVSTASDPRGRTGIAWF
ncbi:MAG: gamma-glutamyltransferase [Rhodocyclaceae bacterium]|nr:gamma-glutamyltransferase [Rhodocyclaceae bacterium]MCA3076171.1 gamma-glutamyltransferase [Rhodocyclaceae bacterium]MCA3089372.1 gamma-glutamyltransferase [Rhodocyclaceae bacterium]MCA3092933.1 gamma-glutamyltransferase [Rhodocyclaceae bacterium]MCA3096976.1 gamma-glutamyltransferase [Rhodocyclaceae bacterium]